MADTKISAETAAAALDGTELSLVVQAGGNRKATTAAIRSQFKGALVKFASDPAGANYTGGANVPWDSEVYDFGGWHDNVTNPSRLTVIAGVTYVRLGAQVTILSTATVEDFAIFAIIKGGSGFAGRPSNTHDIGAASVDLNVTSAIVPVSAGEYFEARLVIQTDTSVVIDALRSWFYIEAVSWT